MSRQQVHPSPPGIAFLGAAIPRPARRALLCGTAARVLCALLALPAAPCSQAADAAGTVWRVGPGRALKTPSAAARLARDGDTVEIEAGLYRDDFAVWHQNDLSLRGVGGMAHLEATRPSPNGKGIWIITGRNTRVENIEFSGARVRDTNGAGIRHEGGDLTLRNTFFHDNEFSLLTGPNPHARVAVYDSRFFHQRRATRFSHGIYVGAVKHFVLRGSHFKGTDQGHQVKSRALRNDILYNRIEDVPGGNSSRLIDLPNCGLSIVMGNDLHQGAGSSNLNAIGYGMEGCDGRSARQRRLYVVFNTFVNEAAGASLVRNRSAEPALVANNLLSGRGVFLQGRGAARDNVAEPLRAWPQAGWGPAPDAAAIDAAQPLPDAPPGLVPREQFRPPAGTEPRPQHGPLDAGSRELTVRGNPAGHR